QCFVCSDDRLAAFESGEHHCLGDACPADQFDDDLCVGIIDDILPIQSHQRARDWVGAWFVESFDGDFSKADGHTETCGHQFVVLLPGVKNSAANSSAADHSKGNLLHKG